MASDVVSAEKAAGVVAPASDVEQGRKMGARDAEWSERHGMKAMMVRP
jgi:hypothetical protein